MDVEGRNTGGKQNKEQLSGKVQNTKRSFELIDNTTTLNILLFATNVKLFFFKVKESS